MKLDEITRGLSSRAGPNDRPNVASHGYPETHNPNHALHALKWSHSKLKERGDHRGAREVEHLIKTHHGDHHLKEGMEQIDELSNDKLTAYKKAATKAPLTKDGDTTAGRILATARKRQKGVESATKRLNEGAEGVSEGVIDAVKGIFGHSVAQKASKAHAARKAARDADKAEAARKASRPTNDVWGNHADTTVKKGAKVHEETEQIDELNRDTLNSYQKKADKDLDHRLPKVIKAHNSSEPLTADDKKNAHKAHSRTIGTMRAHERLNKESVDIPAHDELCGDIGQSPKKAEHTSLSTKGQLKMMAMAKKAKYVSHTGVEVPGTQVKEEAEQIDELSTGTLGSYVKKASSSAAHAGKGEGSSTEHHLRKQYAGDKTRRLNGIHKAVSRLTKESVEQIDELSNETLGKYKKAAGADASAADKAGDFKRGNKRFSGIVKATKKQFANDVKKEEVLISFKDFIKEEVIEEGMRLLQTHGVHGAGGKSAKVYKNAEYGEHVVKFYSNGEHHKDADYHTDDKTDAHDTAKKHIVSKNHESVTYEGEQIDELSGATLKSYGQKAQKEIDSLPSGHDKRVKRTSGAFKALGKRMDKSANKSPDRE